MKPYFDFTELKARLAEHGISPDSSDTVLPLAFSELAKGLAKSEQVAAGIANFGRFTLDYRAERTYTLNGEKYTVPEHYHIHFNPDPDFCRTINAVLNEINPDGLRVLESQD